MEWTWCWTQCKTYHRSCKTRSWKFHDMLQTEHMNWMKQTRKSDFKHCESLQLTSNIIGLSLVIDLRTIWKTWKFLTLRYHHWWRVLMKFYMTSQRFHFTFTWHALYSCSYAVQCSISAIATLSNGTAFSQDLTTQQSQFWLVGQPFHCSTITFTVKSTQVSL